MTKEKKKKRETKLVYKDDKVSLFSDTYNYMLVIGSNRYNYGSLRGLFYGILSHKIKQKLTLNSFKDVKEFQEIHNQSVIEVKHIAINMVDWK
jgi:hypothetical protein